MTDIKHIRNFSIIAHIDHGKSTLADRFIQMCGGLSEREMDAQVLDSMDIERERGITIKAQSVTLDFKAQDGETYQLNFIDTPGHVDFSYEVSRSLAACEGALLVVDAGQGVEAQSVANCYTAIEQGLEVLPVLNKIDLPQADPDRVAQEIEEIIGIEATDACQVSAKTGVGVDALLEQLVIHIPYPAGDRDSDLQALIIDSWFDNYLGVVSLVRVKNGVLRKGDKIHVKSTGQNHSIDMAGVFTPKRKETGLLQAGEVGFVVAGIKDIYGGDLALLDSGGKFEWEPELGTPRTTEFMKIVDKFNELNPEDKIRTLAPLERFCEDCGVEMDPHDETNLCQLCFAIANAVSSTVDDVRARFRK